MLIAIDLDGTLLTSRHAITQRTATAIKQLARNRHRIVLASARMPKAILHYSRMLELTDPIMAYNGAMIVDVTNSRNMFKIDIPVEASRSVIALSKGFNVQIHVYVGDEWYVEKDEALARPGSSAISLTPVRVSDLENCVNNGATKILLIGLPAVLEQILRLLPSDQVSFFRSQPTYLEIVHKNASKGNALKYIAGFLRIANEKIIAIGDSENDLEMFRYAYLSICPQNASKEIRRCANIVTRSNDNDGIAIALEEIFGPLI